MKYQIKIFEVYADAEHLIQDYFFDTLPYVPKRKECLLVGDECYKVVNIATSFDIEENTQVIEIDVKQIDTDKEWWEI